MQDPSGAFKKQACSTGRSKTSLDYETRWGRVFSRGQDCKDLQAASTGTALEDILPSGKGRKFDDAGSRAPRDAFRSVCLHPSIISASGARDRALRGVNSLGYDAARDTLSTCADSRIGGAARVNLPARHWQGRSRHRGGRSLHTACQPGSGEWDQGQEGWLPGSFRVADGRENGALEMACIR